MSEIVAKMEMSVKLKTFVAVVIWVQQYNMYASGKYDWIGPFFGCMKDDANHVFKVDSIATQLIYILR